METTIPIDQYFTTPIIVDKKKAFYVLVNTTIRNSDGYEIDQFMIKCKYTKLYLTEAGEHEPDYTWTPDSYTHDYEVLFPLSEKIQIAEGQGIGVIIIEPLHSYIKLVRGGVDGVYPVFGKWDHSLMARDILRKDLVLGYNVFLIASDEVSYNLCEKRDARNVRKMENYFEGPITNYNTPAEFTYDTIDL